MLEKIFILKLQFKILRHFDFFFTEICEYIIKLKISRGLDSI